MERRLNASRVQRGGLDEGEVVPVRKCPCRVLLHCTDVPQVTLVPHQHDDDVRVCMVSQLLQPPLNVLECRLFRDVVHQQRTHRAAVVRARDGAVPLLTSCAIGERRRRRRCG